jgi:hypothetical protein
MADTRKFLIMNLMRILTPEEINDLTTTYYGEKRVSLTALLDEDFLGISPEENSDTEEVEENKAKILPFNKDAEVPVPQDSPAEVIKGQHKVGQNVLKLFNKLYGISEDSFDGMRTEQVDVKIEKSRKGTSLFILDQKEKLESSQKKLKTKEVMGTYAKVASMDIQTEKEHKDDLAWSSHSGLLVNKKQS